MSVLHDLADGRIKIAETSFAKSLRFSSFSPVREEGRTARMNSTATAEAALADGVAGVLALHEEFLVGHHRLIRMGHPAMLDVGLIIWDPNHQTGRAYRPFLQR
jgi:hypothetical protein